MPSRLLTSLSAWWSRRDRRAELEAEIAFHLAEDAAERRAEGLRPGEAVDAARRDFGNVTLVGEATREAWGWGPIERLGQDIRYGVRALTAAPIVSIVAILTLTLAIGANTAIFSIVSGLLLRPLPVAAPERLVLLSVPLPDGVATRSHWSNPIWEQLRDHDMFEGAFAWGVQRFNLAPSGESDQVSGLWASGRMFEVLGVQAVVGRTLTAADDRRTLGPDGPVAVIGYDFWQRRFGGSHGRARPPHHRGTRAVHHRRRRAAVVLRRRSRTHLRRGDPDRGGHAHPRRRCPRSPHVLVAARDVPPEARARRWMRRTRNSVRSPRPSARRRSPRNGRPTATCARGSPWPPHRPVRRRCAASTSGR